jgi:hydroxymethylpyrimidine pyrophosphatase-like HAD family hydrolase
MKITVAYDVDGTLIHEAGPLEDTPKYENIALFHQFQRIGCKMFIWSGGGIDYADRWARKLGLDAQIVSKGSFQPDIAVDDMDVSLGKINLRVNDG